MKDITLYIKHFILLTVSFLSFNVVFSQSLIPFQFVNNSPDFADSDIYIGLVGQTVDLGGVWIDFSTNSASNGALKQMNYMDNTIHKVSTDWGYAPIFTKLSDIPNKIVYIPAISGCRFFIAFKSPLYIHFHQTGGYAGPNLQSNTDPNSGIRFELIELTNGSNGLWVNTTRVDSYQYPMGLEVLGKSGTANTYSKVGELITHQILLQRWQDTFKNTEFAPCYINTNAWQTNPLGGIIMQPSKISSFSATGASANYFQDYIDRIWKYYSKNELVVSLGDRGIYRGKVDTTLTLAKRDTLKMVGPNGILAYISGKPNTQEVIEGKGKIAEDVLATPDKDADKAFQAQFSAAVNRGTIDLTIKGGQSQDWGNAAKYFVSDIFNKYVWFFHQSDVSYNSKTYAFAYDDVFDNSSTIQSQNPTKVKITIGGFANLVPQQLTSIAVTPTVAKINVGATLKMTAIGYDVSQFPMTITPIWSVSGGTIDNAGNFTATAAGDYNITATVGNLSANAIVTVQQGVEIAGCQINTSSGDFIAVVSKDLTNPTINFIPTIAGTGDATCLLFYSKTPNNWGSVGAHSAKPNVPFTVAGANGDKIYFYYVYSAGTGNKNSMASNDFFVVGNCSGTGLNDVNQKLTFQLYPNPIKDYLTLKIPDSGLNNLKIYDLCGSLMCENKIGLNQTEFSINLKSFNKGVYFLVLNGERASQTVKIIKE
jgi:hypothetical protein